MAKPSKPFPPQGGPAEEPPKLWTPSEKPTESQKKLALMLFMECWKDAVAKDKSLIAQVEPVYRSCLKAAKIIDELKFE